MCLFLELHSTHARSTMLLGGFTQVDLPEGRQTKANRTATTEKKTHSETLDEDMEVMKRRRALGGRSQLVQMVKWEPLLAEWSKAFLQKDEKMSYYNSFSGKVAALVL